MTELIEDLETVGGTIGNETTKRYLLISGFGCWKNGCTGRNISSFEVTDEGGRTHLHHACQRENLKGKRAETGIVAIRKAPEGFSHQQSPGRLQSRCSTIAVSVQEAITGLPEVDPYQRYGFCSFSQ